MKKNILFALFSFILFASCDSNKDNSTTTEIPKDWEIYEAEEFSIQYPKDWKLNTSGMQGTEFILLTELSSSGDVFSENITLLSQDLAGGNMDLKKYTELSVLQIETLITNYRRIESKDIDLNGVDFHKIVYSGDQGFFTLIYEQYWCVENETAYILTFTVKEDEYGTYKNTAESILNSFILK